MKKKSYQIVNINGVDISYIHKNRLEKGPKISVIFLTGYRSDMLGTKAVFLDRLSKKIGYEYLRFNYSGHGTSGGKIRERLLSDWVEETKYFIKKLSYPVIIVGSSLGAWISIILLQKIRKKIMGVIGIGAAADFTDDILKNLSMNEKKTYKNKKIISIDSNYNNQPYIFEKRFIEDSKKNFVLKKPFKTNTNIILLYGLLDEAVKLKKQIEILNTLETENAKLIISKNSDHRMSSDSDLKLLEQSLKNMLKYTL
ncbi:MAG: hypothetical protein CML36_01870 [Rhodobacteraceae bacterium]|nr:hypothetical protein [Paracoccaceae bacterium]OUU62469.1 MAG: hypothetical protein CBC22_04060 [Alphaproteobacteria bacterium TMED62]|tara:strand:+ start:11453 stop:12217 length:765 start_codon:yes stop_codon:yes gene_type:complete